MCCCCCCCCCCGWCFHSIYLANTQSPAGSQGSHDREMPGTRTTQHTHFVTSLITPALKLLVSSWIRRRSFETADYRSFLFLPPHIGNQQTLFHFVLFRNALQWRVHTYTPAHSWTLDVPYFPGPVAAPPVTAWQGLAWHCVPHRLPTEKPRPRKKVSKLVEWNSCAWESRWQWVFSGSSLC